MLDQLTNTLVTGFVSCALGKICKARSSLSCELESPWLVPCQNISELEYMTHEPATFSLISYLFHMHLVHFL